MPKKSAARAKPATRVRARPKAGARSAPAQLDREQIERAALTLIERVGLGEFSMRRLGAALGVEAMSVYHYYPSKAHLLDALLERLIVRVTLSHAPDLAWQEKFRRTAHAYRKLMLEYPRFSQFMLVHRMNTRNGLRWLEGVVRIFHDAGFEPELAARAFRAVGYYICGAVLDETSGYADGPSAAEPVPHEEQLALAPTALGLGPFFKRDHWQKTFDFGLDCLLREIERVAASGDF